MSLRRRLLIGFGSLFLILLAVGFFSIAVLGHYSGSLETLFHENYNSVVYCDHMKQALDDLNQQTESAVWSHADLNATAWHDAVQKFADNIHAQLGNCTLEGEKQLSDKLATEGAGYEAAISVRFVSAAQEDRQKIYRTELLPLYTHARAITQTISDLNLDHMKTVDVRIKQNLISVQDTVFIFIGIGAILAVACVAILAGAILKPLGALMRSVDEVAAGNLDLTLPVSSEDEVGQLAKAFNLMAARLKEYRRIDHARLLRTQQTTQLAIDSLPDAVVVLGPNGEVEISNLAARTHFSIEPGKVLQDLPLNWLRQIFTRTVESKQPDEPRGYQSAIQLFDAGEERFFLPHAVPMFDDQKRVIGVTVILVDVTRLRHADELKSGLVSTVSHELKTPLTSARMAVYMLSDQTVGALNPKQLMLANAARVDIDRLYRIIENLLNMSRIESGRTALQLAAMAPERILTQSLEPMKAEFAKKNIAVSVNIPSQLSDVLADGTCIGHVVTNLLSNALKFTPAGGHVEISAAENGDGVNFTVSDNGPGVPAESLPRLFEKFYRVQTPDGPSGAGLGLAIAKEIIEAHGGNISVASPPGRGACFTFFLKSATPVTSGTYTRPV